MSVSSGSSSSSWDRSTVRSDARSRKSSISGWTNSSSRSREHRIPNTPAVNSMIWLAGGKPSRVKKVRVYEDTYERDPDGRGSRGRVETKKEYDTVFVVSSSSGRAYHSSRRTTDDHSWAKGRNRGGGGGARDSDDDSDDDASGPEYGQPVPAPTGIPPGVGPMGGHPPPPPPPGFPGRPGMGPPPPAGQFGRPPPPAGQMPPFPGGAGFHPPPQPPPGFKPR